jgi:putative ABC transport system ATP-binding protein
MHTTSGREPSLHVSKLSIEYTRGVQKVRPIDDLSFSASPGSVTLLLGPSGCGKTSVLSTLGAMMTPASGSVRVGETEVVGLKGSALTEYRRLGVGIVFQAFNLLPSLSALENVSVVLRGAGVHRRTAKSRAENLLQSLGLGERLHHRPDDLSGGQQQRVAIARAIALNPMLVLADEPTAHLDHASVQQVLELHRRLADEGRIVVVSTHDDRMLPIASQVIELGKRTSAGPAVSGIVKLKMGETLFQQGDRGEFVYVIRSGRLRIDRQEPDGSTITLAHRSTGDHVGEMAPLFLLPRSASVIAEVDSVVEGMTTEAFRSEYGVTHLVGGQ